MNNINSNNELIAALIALNPNVTIEHDDTYGWISTNASKLNVPHGFYYNHKNGITNKHNSADGHYISVAVI